MKMMLSMPSTSSSAVKVKKAIQVGLNNNDSKLHRFSSKTKKIVRRGLYTGQASIPREKLPVRQTHGQRTDWPEPSTATIALA